MAVCGLSLRQESTESRKTLEQKLIFQIATLDAHGINECFSFNYFFLFLQPLDESLSFWHFCVIDKTHFRIILLILNLIFLKKHLNNF